MPSARTTDFTRLLNEWQQGHHEAGERLIALVYHDLRRLARQYLSQERASHSLQPTALVHELWLRLFGEGPQQWNDRQHFFAVAARQMRRLLIDHARQTSALKRQTDQPAFASSFFQVSPIRTSPEELLALDEALSRLERINPRSCQVVELRFFSGCTEEESARVLEISVATLKREWVFARAWLHKEMLKSSQSSTKQ